MKTSKTILIKSLIVITVLFFSNCSDSANGQSQDNKPGDKKKIQIALILDTSNSMDGLIDQAKSQLWTIVNELAKAKCDNTSAELQIALYEYGNNDLPSSEGFIRMVTPLTSDLDQVSKDLFELTTNGGDEFCGQAIHTALKQLNWSNSDADLQMIYIAGNEPFTQGGYSYKTACGEAKGKQVVVNTIHCGGFEEGISGSWKNGADITGGSYSSIEQNKKTVFIDSPYDKKIEALNTKLNDTYIPYGQLGRVKKENQRIQDENAKQYGVANSAKRAASKSSHVYKNTSWDLVDAAEEAEFDIAEVSESELPAEMKSMDDSERKAYVDKKAKERKAIATEIQELSKKRAVYVAEQRASENAEDMLDQVMIKSLKKQAATKNFVIE